jgi:glutathione S-transferase
LLIAPDLLKPHANIVAYRARCMERAAWKKTIAAYCERVEATELA